MAPVLAEWNHFIKHRLPLETLSSSASSSAATSVCTSGARSVEAARTFAKLTGSSVAARCRSEECHVQRRTERDDICGDHKQGLKNIGNKDLAPTSIPNVAESAEGKRIFLRLG
ncbi:hypothetical protein V8E36_007932 [Tilletia maclaganii]